MIDQNFFKNKGPFSLEEILSSTGGKLLPPKSSSNLDATRVMIHNIGSLSTASEKDLTFFTNPKYLESFKTTKALLCITDEAYVKYAPEGVWILLADSAHKAYAIAAAKFYPTASELPIETLKEFSASVSADARIGPRCYIGHNVVIEANCEIDEGCYIDSGSVIKKGVKIGKFANIGANVTIANSYIGDDFKVLAGSSIGQEGFGFAMHEGSHYSIPQIGRVIIGNKVEIGAGTTIDRGSLGDTIISDNVRIDNLVQIGHNVSIGVGTVIVAQVGIAGSSKIGDYVIIAGQVGVAGHITVGDHTKILGQSGVTKNIAANSTVIGCPAINLRDWQEQLIALKKLTKNK